MTSLERRMAWIGMSWVMCVAAALGLVGWTALTIMFVGALMIGDD